MKEWGQTLKKEKWGRRNIMRLLREMMASVSADSSPERPFAILSAGRSGSFENLQIPFSWPDPLHFMRPDETVRIISFRRASDVEAEIFFQVSHSQLDTLL
jgi:hypothetical protein